MTEGDDFKEKIRSISFGHRPAAPKKVVHRTDTAFVTETDRTERSGKNKSDHHDVHVALTDHVRPHAPEMTQAYWRDKRAKEGS